MEDDLFDKACGYEASQISVIDMCRYLSIKEREAKVLLDALTLRSW